MRLVAVKKTKLGAHDSRSGMPLGDVAIHTAQLNLAAVPLKSHNFLPTRLLHWDVSADIRAVAGDFHS